MVDSASHCDRYEQDSFIEIMACINSKQILRRFEACRDNSGGLGVPGLVSTPMDNTIQFKQSLITNVP
jgi:hypothetical protein